MIGQQQRHISSRKMRKGIQVLEGIMVIPILLLVSFSFFVVGPAITVKQSVQSAADEAAKEVAKTIANQSDRRIGRTTVNEVLSVHGLALGPNSRVMTVIEQLNEVICLGDASVATCPATSSVLSPEIVKVTVYVGADSGPIPNLLASSGFDFSARVIEVESIALRDF